MQFQARIIRNPKIARLTRLLLAHHMKIPREDIECHATIGLIHKGSNLHEMAIYSNLVSDIGALHALFQIAVNATTEVHHEDSTLASDYATDLRDTDVPSGNGRNPRVEN